MVISYGLTVRKTKAQLRGLVGDPICPLLNVHILLSHVPFLPSVTLGFTQSSKPGLRANVFKWVRQILELPQFQVPVTHCVRCFSLLLPPGCESHIQNGCDSSMYPGEASVKEKRVLLVVCEKTIIYRIL